MDWVYQKIIIILGFLVPKYARNSMTMKNSNNNRSRSSSIILFIYLSLYLEILLMKIKKTNSDKKTGVIHTHGLNAHLLHALKYCMRENFRCMMMCTTVKLEFILIILNAQFKQQPN